MSETSTNVLLIEDNPGDADLVCLRLLEGDPKTSVRCADRLSEGIKQIQSASPDVVLLDLNLPDSRGAETFRRVLDAAPELPVVILSGQQDEELAMKALHQGVQDYLVKGEISSRQLERSIRYAVERQTLLRSLETSRRQQLEFKNQFLSHVSHELRTPLTAIHQYVTLLLDNLAGPLLPQQRDHLGTILKSVHQLHAMIRDLLEATRAETGKIRLQLRCVSMSELIHQAVTMMQVAAREKRIGLEMGFDSRVPLVCADPDRILEVLINLIDNGIKFTPPEGSVVVRACMVEVDPDMVYVSVTDTGRGITAEAKLLIFERLYQDPDSVDNRRAGLGLGLFISRELVKLHGGRIWVASDPGNGSTFSFTVPLYSLGKLLAPVLIYEGHLRDAVALVKVELVPDANVASGRWKDTAEKCFEVLQRCVYLDKDLVLPPMAAIPGAKETFFVVASTDMQRVSTMIARIRQQLEPRLEASGRLVISAVPVPIPELFPGQVVEDQPRQIAEIITEMIMPSYTGRRHDTKEVPAPQSAGD